MSGSNMPLAFGRWTGGVRCLRLKGIDLSAEGADALMQIRSAPNLPDGDGEPLRELPLVSDGEGLRFLGVHHAAGTPTSFLALRVFSLSDMPAAADIGDDIDLAHDLHVKPAGGLFQRVAWGTLRVEAGVTRPDALLAEDGGFLLAEDGGRIIEE